MKCNVLFLFRFCFFHVVVHAVVFALFSPFVAQLVVFFLACTPRWFTFVSLLVRLFALTDLCFVCRFDFAIWTGYVQLHTAA